MNYTNISEYADAVAKEALKYLPEKYKEATVKVVSVEKNNGITYTGIAVMRPENNIAPTAYLDDLYKWGASIEEACNHVSSVTLRADLGPISAEDIRNYDKIKDMIFPKLVNKEMNRQFLEKKPYTEFLDMAVTYYVRLDCLGNRKGAASTVVTNDLLNAFGISVEQLHEVALQNLRGEGYRFTSLSQRILEMWGCADIYDLSEDADFLSQPDDGDDMYVLSNPNEYFGAAVLLNPDAINTVIEKLGDFIVIPSSVDEIIIVPMANEDTQQALKDVVKEMNIIGVNPRDVLSNNIYRYETTSGELEIVAA